MDINLVKEKALETGAEVALYGVFEKGKLSEELAEVDKSMDGYISALIKEEKFKGETEEIKVFPTFGKVKAEKVAIIGLGSEEKYSANVLRKIIGSSARVLQKGKVKTIAASFASLAKEGLDDGALVQAAVEGALLGTYTFNKYKSKNKETLIEGFSLSLEGVAGAEEGAQRGKVIAEAVAKARDMINEPGNFMNPTQMTEEAKELAKKHDNLKLTILEKEEMQKLGMGGLLGVAQGSSEPPRLLILEYKGGSGEGADIAYVGKGVTFDSGGISIKPSNGMEDMKSDMSGAASVISVMDAIARLKPKCNVTALAPVVENMPSGTAIRPGDVLTASNGKTIEVITTDAEGRMILADAICYAQKLGAKRIVDIATLTGSMVIALGSEYTGGFSNNEQLIKDVIEAGKLGGDKIWQMPIDDEYRKLYKSQVADIKNVGTRAGGSITAALFLNEFIENDLPWVHLDIAGTSFLSKEDGHFTAGGTGVPVATLANLAIELGK